VRRAAEVVESSIIVISSFLIAFKAVLLEGSEVAILSLATINQLGKRNVFLGVLLGSIGSLAIFLALQRVFLFLPDIAISFVAGGVLLYFSSRFLRGFIRYYFRGKSFGAKMTKMQDDVVERNLKRLHSPVDSKQQVPFSLPNSLPVFAITLTEGFEASIVLSAAGAFNLQWTLIGAAISLILIITVSAVSYDYLMRVPRWLLDLIAGVILLTFGLLFIGTGILDVLARL
jgi:uncharacterized membrane protein